MKTSGKPRDSARTAVFRVIPVLAMAVWAGPAAGQSDSYRRQFPAQGRVEVSLGGFTPNSVETRTDDTSTWTRLGISFRLGNAPGPVSPHFFADFGSQSGRLLDSNGIYELRRRRSFAGLGGGWSASTRVPGSGWALDVNVGAGVWFLEIAEDFTNGAGSSAGTNRVLDRAAQIGPRLRGALREPHGWFLEIVWQDPGTLRGLSYAGTSVAVGKRF